MNATLPPLPRLIAFMRACAGAKREDWASLSRKVGDLPMVTVSEAGDAAFILTHAARRIVMQLPLVVVESDGAMRMTLMCLSDMLQQELNAAGGQPYYIDKG